MATDNSKAKKDLIFSLAILLASILVIVEVSTYPFRAKLFPLVTAYFMVIAVMLDLFLTYRRRRSKETSPKEAGKTQSPGGQKRLLFSLLLMVGYMVLIPLAGFLISSILFVGLWVWVLKTDRLAKDLMICVLNVGLIYIIFTIFLDVSLPKGLLEWL